MAIINLKLENQLLTKTNEVILSSGDNEVDSHLILLKFDSVCLSMIEFRRN